jgi:hypothetical protein
MAGSGAAGWVVCFHCFLPGEAQNPGSVRRIFPLPYQDNPSNPDAIPIRCAKKHDSSVLVISCLTRPSHILLEKY